jgi:hypothetical protein
MALLHQIWFAGRRQLQLFVRELNSRSNNRQYSFNRKDVVTMGAPKGNKYAVGNHGGRPPKYKTPEEMQQIIDQYFADCEVKALTDKEGNPVYDKYGQPVTISKPPTITGLALALGFNSRLALLNYEDKEEFVNTVMRAKAKVEEYAETRLFDKDGANGAKFSLANNFKSWKEKQEVDMSGGLTIKLEGEAEEWGK